MRRRLDPRLPGGAISPQQARDQADAFLVSQGVDLTRFHEPEIRSQQLAARTDLEVRYRDRVDPPGEGTSHGLQVRVRGRPPGRFRALGATIPANRSCGASLRGVMFGQLARLIVIYPFLLLLAPPFLKRYHEGEIGVRRGAQIFLLILGCGALLLLLSAAAQAQDGGFGRPCRAARRPGCVVLIMLVFFTMPAAVLAFFAWSVGESVCRERWGHKLAAFDALLPAQLGERHRGALVAARRDGGAALAGLHGRGARRDPEARRRPAALGSPDAGDGGAGPRAGAGEPGLRPARLPRDPALAPALGHEPPGPGRRGSWWPFCWAA